MAEQIMKSLMSPDNQIRQTTEKEFETLAATNHMMALELLVQGLQLPQSELAELASLLFTKTFIEKPDNFAKLTKEQLMMLVQVGSTLMNNKDSPLSYMKRMSDLVVKILLQIDDCDTMMTILMSQAQKIETMNQKMSLMYYIEIMCEFAFDDKLLLKNAEALNQIFVMYLADTEAKVRVSALKSMATFLSSIEEESVLSKFSGAVPILIQKTVEAIQLDQEASVTAIQSISELLEMHPKFLKPVYADLIALFTQIMDQTSLLMNLRKVTLHGLQMLCHCCPMEIRKSDVFKQQTIISLLKMLMEVDEQTDNEWEQQLEDNFISQSDISSTAQDCLSKISGDLTVKFLLPMYIPLIVKCLQSSNWKEQHAGLTAMAMLTEDTEKFFASELDNIMTMLLAMCQSQNKRIIYDLLTCIALLCQEFHPNIQTKYGNQILNLITSGMQQSFSMKVQFRSVSCLVDFCRELVDDQESAQQVLMGVAQPLLENLYKLIESSLSSLPNITNNQSRIAQESLTALSTLAASLKKQFAGFYDTLMPVMMKIMNSLQKEQNEIKMLVIECMGFLLTSISENRKEQFTNDSKTLMQVFLQHQSTLEKDDLQHPSLFCFYAQVAEGMKSEFATYLPNVFDRVEQAIKIDLGFSVQDFNKNQTPSSNKVAKVKIDLKFLGEKTVELNTSALEQKIEGAHTLLALLEACTKSFAPYLQRTAEIVKEYIPFKHSREIRETMVKCIYFLMLACNNEAEMNQMIEFLAPALFGEISKLKVCEDSKILLEQLSESIRLIKIPIMSDSILEGIINSCSKVIQMCSAEKNDILKEISETDAEGKESLNEELEDIDTIQDHITDICAHLVKVYQMKVENVIVNNIMPEYFKNLTGNNELMMVSGIAFFNNVLPHCSQEMFNKGFESICKVYMGLANCKDLTTRQNVLYGFGNFAQRAQQGQFKNIAATVIEMAKKIMEEPDAKSLNKVNSFETAVSTVGKLGLFQQESSLLEVFLDNLPLQYADAQETHLMLLQEVKKQNPSLIQVQDKLLKKLQDIKMQDCNNPENEILCDEGRLIMNSILTN